jgi:DNA polymerase IV (DinB-like DNA polymerase)
MRIVAHIDMDAFYAAIEERDTPRFRGLPLAVGADPEGGKGRGVVSTANYKAREYGIHSAMPISTAWRLSEAAQRQGKPPVVFLSVDMNKYTEVSQRVMAVIRGLAPVVEEAGIDEAYADLSSAGSYGPRKPAWPSKKRFCPESGSRPRWASGPTS